MFIHFTAQAFAFRLLHMPFELPYQCWPTFLLIRFGAKSVHHRFNLPKSVHRETKFMLQKGDITRLGLQLVPLIKNITASP